MQFWWNALQQRRTYLIIGMVRERLYSISSILAYGPFQIKHLWFEDMLHSKTLEKYTVTGGGSGHWLNVLAPQCTQILSFAGLGRLRRSHVHWVIQHCREFLEYQLKP